VWMSGEDALPTLRVKPFDGFDFATGADVARRDVDHCYTGWDGRAVISWAHRPLALQIEASPNLRCAVVYASAAKNEFCFEPVAHLNDAINRATEFAMPVVAPGARFESRIVLRAITAG
jgi:aldose 1-epimerase